MGSYISKGMSGAMEKMQEQQKAMMERQILVQNEMRQRGMATQIAFSREMFMWLGSFYVIATTGAILGFMKTKKPGALVPILPLTFIVGYQGDLAYGDKIKRVQGIDLVFGNTYSLTEFARFRKAKSGNMGIVDHQVLAEAENIMLNEGSLLNLPHGLPTIEHIDELREKK